MQFANTKYAFIYKLNEPLKKDKLDQILLFDFAPVDFLSPKLIAKDEQGRSSFRSRSLQTKKNSYTCWMLDWFVETPYKQNLVVILSNKDELESEIYQELGVSENHHLLSQMVIVYEQNSQKLDNQSISLVESIKSFVNKFSNQKKENSDSNDSIRKIEYKPKEIENEQSDDKKSKENKKWIENPTQWIGKFLHSSKPLNKEDFVRLNNNNFIRAENGKVAVLQKEFSQCFEKYLLLTCLSSAYTLAIKKATLSLAYQSEFKATHLEDLLTECKQSLEFIRNYYFVYPLSSQTSDLVHLWEEVSNQVRLPDLYDEFIEKFDLINKSISFRKMISDIKSAPIRQAQREIDHKSNIKKLTNINRSLIIFGSILVLIGLVNLTPFSINYFLQNWLDVILTFVARIG